MEPGTYYIVIYDNYFINHYTGKYNITANFTPANNNEVEPNNGTAQAQPLEFGEVLNGFLSYSDSTDVFMIDVPNKSDITINVKAALTAWVSLKVRDNEDNVIFIDSYKSTTSNPAKIKETLNLKPGKYYVEIFDNNSFDYAFGNYELYVTGHGITTFKDYQPAYWANSFVWGAKNNIINGDKKSNLLNPNKNITEAQWLAMLLRYAYDAKDSTSGIWYNSYYTLAKQQGIPVANKPNQPLRRGTVAMMLVKVYTGQTVLKEMRFNGYMIMKLRLVLTPQNLKIMITSIQMVI